MSKQSEMKLHTIMRSFWAKKDCIKEVWELKRVILVSEWLENWTLKDKMIFIPNTG